MKYAAVLCLLSLVVLSQGKPSQQECEVGTHAYSPGCGQITPEATCDQPNPVAEKATVCDYSACYCDPPTLRDTKSGKCVAPEDCPK